ncbi:MAG: PAS domain S-box protein, partial [Halanaerobacter sp.]
RWYNMEHLSERRLNNIFDSLLLPILIIDANGIIKYANNAGADLLQTSIYFQGRPCEGSNYIDYLKTSQNYIEKTNKVLDGIKSVIAKQKSQFTFNQFSFKPGEKELFTVEATAFKGSEKLAVLAYRSFTLKDKSFYQSLFANSLQAFALHRMIFDEQDNPIDYRFLDCNQAFEEQTGLKAEEVIGERATEVIPGLEETEFIQEYGKVVQTQKSKRFTSFSAPLERWYQIFAYPMGKNKFITVFIDITARKELEYELKMNQFLVDKAPIGIIRHTPQGEFEYANEKASKLFDYSQDELLKKKVTDFDPNYSTKNLRQLWQAVETKENINLERELETKAGTTFTAQITARYLEYHNKDYIFAFVQDITERKKQEAQLREQFNKGKKLHRHLLPTKLPCFNGVKKAAFYSPAAKIGADFYQAIEFNNKIILYVSDITGHSLDGAFLNLQLRETIRNLLDHLDGKLNLNKLIDYIHYRYQLEDLPDDYFISLLLFVIDKRTNRVEYINAGQHINPILVKCGELIDLTVSGPPISNTIAPEFYDLESEEFRLDEDSSLIITTDGLVEEKSDGQIYGEERLRKIVANNYNLPPEILLDTIITDLKDFSTQSSPKDDITVLAVNNLKRIDQLSITIPAKFEKLAALKEEIQEFLADYYQRLDELLIGLHEIAANAIEHGGTEQYQNKVEVEVSVLEDSIFIEVEDEGEGFEWQTAVEQELTLTDFQERGRGIALANKAFDHISYNQTGNKAVLYLQRQ